MPIFDFNGLSTSEIKDFARLADAAYAGGTPPPGWFTVSGQTLGTAYTGDTFSNGPAAARVFRNGDTLALSFRGTDSALTDIGDITSLLTGNSYINDFAALLDDVAAFATDAANGISEIQVTGHSLGAAAANILRNVADTQFGGAFSDATYVTFAAPKIATNANILNIGHQNDWVFKTLEGGILGSPQTFFSSTDNIVWYNDLAALNNDLGLGVRSLPEFLVNADSSPHAMRNYIETVDRLSASEFYGATSRDMIVLVAETDLTVTPLGASSGGAAGPALILGGARNEVLRGGNSGDFIEAEGGADYIEGGAGADRISAGSGNDAIIGGAGNDTIDGGTGRDVAFFLDAGSGLTADLRQSGTNATSQAGNDELRNIEDLITTNGNDSLIGDARDNLFVSQGGSDTLIGNGGNDMLIAGAGGGDVVSGGAGADVLDLRDSNSSTLTGGADADCFIFAGRISLDESNDNTHRVTDYDDALDFIILDTVFANSFSDLTITQLGHAARIEIGSLDLRLDNTLASVIDAGDIVFT